MPDGYEVANSCLDILVDDARAIPIVDAVGKRRRARPADASLRSGHGRRRVQGQAVGQRTTSINADVNEDNCILIANPTRLNTDGDFIDLAAVHARSTT